MKVRSLLAVALLAPSLALAAPSSGSKSSSKSSSSDQAKSSAATPTSQSAPPSQYGGLSVGGFLGYETDDVSGVALRLDGELPFKALSPQVKMSWVGSIGYSHLTNSGFAGADFTANVLKIVPAARFTLPLNPQFDVFGDVGLGIAYVSVTADFPGTPAIPPFFPGTPGFSQSDSSFNIMMRIGAGAWFHVNPQLRVGAMLEFDPIFGDFGFSGASSQNTFNIIAGMMYRL
jgi:opacity protein-like surface antigen